VFGVHRQPESDVKGASPLVSIPFDFRLVESPFLRRIGDRRGFSFFSSPSPLNHGSLWHEFAGGLNPC